MFKDILFFNDGDRIYPGKKISSSVAPFIIGQGVYQRGNELFAGALGFLRLEKVKDPNQAAVKVEEDVQQYQLSVTVSKSDEKAPHDINIGDEVYGRIEKLRDDSAFVQILVINGKATEQYYDGILKKKDIRKQEVDKIKMEECFLPDDIIKARVHSYGDSRKIQLSTIENEHGVIFAKGYNSRKLLFPVNWNEMIDPSTKEVEKRKVAKPDDLNTILEDY